MLTRIGLSKEYSRGYPRVGMSPKNTQVYFVAIVFLVELGLLAKNWIQFVVTHKPIYIVMYIFFLSYESAFKSKYLIYTCGCINVRTMTK